MAPRHLVSEPERRHVIHHGFARGEHHRLHRTDDAGIVRERHPDPFVRDGGRGEGVVPRQPAERVPVGLVEVRAAPVPVRSHVGDAGEALDLLPHRRPGAARVGVGAEHLLPQRREERQMGVLAEVFLGDLELHHQRRPGHGAEQWTERLARLEIERPVLYLEQHVLAERAVLRREFIVRLADAVGGDRARVDERPPHHDAAVRGQGIGQHVGAVGMRAAVVLWAGLPLRVRLHDKSAEVRNGAVDLVHLAAPPRPDDGVARIGRGEAAQLDGRAEARREVHAQAVRTKHVGERGDLAEVLGRERRGIRVHVREHRAVDPE